MKLKRDIYSDPDRPMDKALMLIERAREAKKTDVRADLLAKAAAELMAAEAEERAEQEQIEEEGRKCRAVAAANAPAPSTPEPGAKGSKSERAKGGKEATSKGRDTPSNDPKIEPTSRGVTFTEDRFRQGAKERARLWAAVVRIAVEAKLWEVAHLHTAKLLSTEWDVNRDRDMVLLQAEVAFLDAEACAGLLKERGIELIPPEEKDRAQRSAGTRTTSDVPADVGAQQTAATPVDGVEDSEESGSRNSAGVAFGRNRDFYPRESGSSPEEKFDARPYQERAYCGCLEGAEKGLALNEAWLVTNAAASLWNNLPAAAENQTVRTVGSRLPTDARQTADVASNGRDAGRCNGLRRCKRARVRARARGTAAGLPGEPFRARGFGG